MTEQVDRRIYQVKGMTCDHCRAAVESAIRQVADVREVSVDLKAGKAVVVGIPSDHAIIAAVEEAGYEANVATIDS